MTADETEVQLEDKGRELASYKNNCICVRTIMTASADFKEIRLQNYFKMTFEII